MKPLISLFVILGVTFSILFIPLPNVHVSTDILAQPSAAHWLGTTATGMDTVSLLALGAIATIGVGLSAGIITVVLGIMTAYLTEVTSARVQCLIMLVVDILIALPETAFLLLLATFLRPGPLGLIFILVVTSWAGEIRIFAVAIRSELARDSVYAARLFNGGHMHIFSKHIAPAILRLASARTVASTRRATLKHAGLAFLGFVNPLTPSWGGIMQEGFEYIHTNAWYWLMLPPIVSLSLYLLLIFNVGEYLAKPKINNHDNKKTEHFIQRQECTEGN